MSGQKSVTAGSTPGCVTLRFRLPKREIGYVKFVVEGYDGLAQLVSQPGRGEMVWLVPCEREQEALELADALAEKLELRLVRLTRDG